MKTDLQDGGMCMTEKKYRSAALVFCTALLLAGCQMRGQEAGTDEKDTAGIDITEEENGEETYTFQDKEGVWHKAELLSGVPKCTYDFSRLKTDKKTGYKYYKDKDDSVSSRIGIDVSEFQGEEIDWKKVKDSGVEFAIIRLGYRAYGEEGELVPDAMYEKNIQGTLDAGLETGVYFFSQAASPVEAVEEAEYVLERIRGYDIDGPIVYDTEDIEYAAARTDKNTRQEITNYCKAFCDTIEAAGYDSMIYSNMKWMAFTLDMEELSGYDFWYADYHTAPQCPYKYKIWQYSETGTVPGISGSVNLNLWFQEDE